jgi:hypothetical protein
VKRTWKREREITGTDLTRWWSWALLLCAVVQAVLTVVGQVQGRDVELNGLWTLALTTASMALRNSVRADEQEKRIADLEMRAQATYEQILIMEREARG